MLRRPKRHLKKQNSIVAVQEDSNKPGDPGFCRPDCLRPAGTEKDGDHGTNSQKEEQHLHEITDHSRRERFQMPSSSASIGPKKAFPVFESSRIAPAYFGRAVSMTSHKGLHRYHPRPGLNA